MKCTFLLNDRGGLVILILSVIVYAIDALYPNFSSVFIFWPLSLSQIPIDSCSLQLNACFVNEDSHAMNLSLCAHPVSARVCFMIFYLMWFQWVDLLL